MLTDEKNIKQLVDELSAKKILVSRMQASKILNVDHNRFNKLFVESGMITPIKIGKQVRYDVKDVYALPEQLKRMQRVKKDIGEGLGNVRDRMNMIFDKAYQDGSRR